MGLRPTDSVSTWGAEAKPRATWSEDPLPPLGVGPMPPTHFQGVRETPGRYGPEGAELGRGGLGRVVARWDHALEREVALKELLWDEEGPDLVRFLREARITAALEHPAIVPVYELGIREDGSRFYTMRRIRGHTLEAALQACGSLSDRMALLDSFITACQAVAYAHSRGVVHRDLKPSNIMVGSFGETVVLDWGLAKAQGLDEVPFDEPAFEVDARLTRTGSVMGTPAYMSPEQANGDVARVDARSDVHALGVILWEVLVGMQAFRGDSLSILEAVRDVARPEVRGPAPEIPPDLAAIAEKAMAWSPEDRYPNAGALSADVEAFRAGRPVTAYRYAVRERAGRFAIQNPLLTGTWLTAGVLLVGMAASAVWQLRAARQEAEEARVAAAALEDKLTTRLAEALEASAAAAWLDGDPATAEAAAVAALALGERPLARGIWLGALRQPRLRALASLDGVPRYGELAWDPAGRRLALSGPAGEIVVLDGERPETFLWRGAADPHAVVALAWSLDGQSLAVAHRHSGVEVWPSAGGQATPVPLPPRFDAESLAWLPDGRLAVGGPSSLCVTWPTTAGCAVGFATGPVAALATSPDGRWLAGSEARQLGVWDVATGVRVLTGADEEPVVALAWSPGGEAIAAGTDRGRVLRYGFDPAPRGLLAPLAAIAAHRGPIRALAWSRHSVYSLGEDGRARSWDGRLRPRASLPDPAEHVTSLAVVANGTTLATRAGGPLRLWTDAPESDRFDPWWLTVGVFDLAWAPDGAALAAVDRTGALWTGSPAGPVVATAGGVKAVAWVAVAPWTWSEAAAEAGSPACGALDTAGSAFACLDDAGALWASLGGDQPKQIWSSEVQYRLAGVGADGSVDLVQGRDWLRLSGDGREVFRRELPDAPGTVLARSPVGTWMAGDVADGGVLLVGERESRVLIGHREGVTSLAFSPDGQTLASASTDHTARLWSVADGREVARLPHREAVARVAFAADGQTLATGGAERVVRFWATQWPPPDPASR